MATGSIDLALAKLADVAKWIAENPGYEKTYISVKAKTVGSAATPTDATNKYTVSLIAEKSDTTRVTLAYGDVAGDALDDGGFTLSQGILGGALEVSSGGLGITLGSGPVAANMEAEFELQGVDLNASLTVKNNDDGGSAALAKAFADAGFDFSDIAAGGHEVSFRTVTYNLYTHSPDGIDSITFGIVIDGVDSGRLQVTGAGFTLTKDGTTNLPTDPTAGSPLTGAGTAENPYKITFADGTTSIFTKPDGAAKGIKETLINFPISALRAFSTRI
jgi:hypothetical protein